MNELYAFALLSLPVQLISIALHRLWGMFVLPMGLIGCVLLVDLKEYIERHPNIENVRWGKEDWLW